MNELINKINLGDCMDIMKNIPENSIDLVLTDPPFGMSFKSNHRIESHREIENDDNLLWLPDWCQEIKRISKEDAFIFIFCSWHFVDVFKIEIQKYIPVKNILIWHKNNTGMGDLVGDFAPQHELILFCNLGGKPLLGRRDSNILKFPKTNNELHPTQKPVDMIRYLASKTLYPGDGIVFDPFSGSGTTAIACHDLGLNFICIEKDEQYHASSVERLEKHQRQGKLF